MVLALNPPVLRRLAPFFKVEAPVVSKLPLAHSGSSGRRHVRDRNLNEFRELHQSYVSRAVRRPCCHHCRRSSGAGFVGRGTAGCEAIVQCRSRQSVLQQRHYGLFRWGKSRQAHARSPNRPPNRSGEWVRPPCRTLRVACCCDRLLPAGFAASDRSARPAFLRAGAASRGAMTAPRQA
jgi:hypothetical protein